MDLQRMRFDLTQLLDFATYLNLVRLQTFALARRSHRQPLNLELP